MNLTLRRRFLGTAYVTLVVVTAIVVVWTMRQGWAVYKLRRGVGDTWFYSAEGKPWFRMDEQRRDVSLDEIAPDLRNAVIAVEDHRFFHHFGIDPIATQRGGDGHKTMMRPICAAHTAPSASVSGRSVGVRDGYTYPIRTNTSALSASSAIAFTLAGVRNSSM